MVGSILAPEPSDAFLLKGSVAKVPFTPHISIQVWTHLQFGGRLLGQLNTDLAEDILFFGALEDSSFYSLCDRILAPCNYCHHP